MKKIIALLTLSMSLALMQCVGVSACDVDIQHADEGCVETQVSTEPVTNSEDETKSNERFFLDNNIVNLEGKFDSSVFFVGNKIKDQSVGSGLVFGAGSELEVAGSHDYGFYLGNDIVIRGTYTDDVFAAGSQIAIEQDAKIGRDVFVAGSTVRISADIPGSVYIASQNIKIENATIHGDLRVATSKIEFGENVKIEGVFGYNEDIVLQGTALYEETDVYTPLTFNYSRFQWTFRFAMLIADIITMVLVLVVARRFFAKLSESIKNFDIKDTLFNLLAGLVGLIAAAMAIGLLCVTVVGLPAALIVTLALVILLVAAQTVTAFVIGEKFLRLKSSYLNSGITMVVLVALGWIPHIGPFISSISAFYGLGILIRAIFKK